MADRSPTDFQIEVWQDVQRIPWGETKTYDEIAQVLGTSARAVGGALRGLNDHPDMEAVVPWHRVTRGSRLMGNHLEINDRTREQARLLVLEGHTVEPVAGRYTVGRRLRTDAIRDVMKDWGKAE